MPSLLPPIAPWPKSGAPLCVIVTPLPMVSATSVAPSPADNVGGEKELATPSSTTTSFSVWVVTIASNALGCCTSIVGTAPENAGTNSTLLPTSSVPYRVGVPFQPTLDTANWPSTSGSP